ncbi:Protein trichome birefringence-like 25 [Senna tora]|uniref:Protein trichome birefringence-like 25 n=1 Tax=Senna tora TaxID=362788 RepID=A0A834T633_9FABA|nr:Protein trichome birefringence-like 25 [Senna tora]
MRKNVMFLLGIGSQIPRVQFITMKAASSSKAIKIA